MFSRFLAHWGCAFRSWKDRLSSSSAPASTPAQAPRTGQEVEPPQAGAAAGNMRSLEELRTDLARLRASSKERHAAAPIRRQQSFDDEVFANFVAPVAPTPDPAGQEDYTRTVYVPRKPSPAK